MNRIDDLIRELSPKGINYRLLKEVCTIKAGQSVNKLLIQANPGEYPVINSGREPLGFINKFNCDEDPLGITSRGAGVGSVTWQDGKYFRGNLNYAVSTNDGGKLDSRFLYHLLNSMQVQIQNLSTYDGIPALNKANLETLKIPVPPFEVQQEIVRVLDQFTKVEAELEVELAAELEARRLQYEHYRNELLTLDGVLSRPLGDMAENLDSRRKPVTRSARTSGDIPYYGASGVVDYVSDFIFDGDFLLVSEDGANLLARSTPIAFSISGKTWVNNHAHVLRFETYVERRFVEIYLNSIDLSPYVSGAAQPKLNKANLNRIPVPDPSLDEKRRIVALLDRFDTLVNDIYKGLPAELAARRKQYEYYRDRLMTFEEATA